MPNQKLKYHEGQQLSSARFTVSKPSTVARTMLIGVLEPSWFRCNIATPRQFHNELQISISNSKPSTAGFNNTLAPTNSEKNLVWIVVPTIGTSIKFAHKCFADCWNFLSFTSTKSYALGHLNNNKSCETKTMSTILVTRLTATTRF